MGGRQVSPQQLLADYEANLPTMIEQNGFIELVYDYLKKISQPTLKRITPLFMGM